MVGRWRAEPEQLPRFLRRVATVACVTVSPDDALIVAGEVGAAGLASHPSPLG
jgi:hypothetical protein